MSPHRRSDRAAPLLLLLLLVLSINCILQPSLLRGSSAIPPKGVHYLQLGGEVTLPGVYAFPSAPSIDDLLARAGASPAGAQRTGSYPILCSGERIEVKREGREVRFRRGEMSGFYKMTLGIPLSINKESETGFTALPGIGPTLARMIVEARLRRGGFKTLDEVGEIPGIGYQRFLKIRPFIRL